MLRLPARQTRSRFRVRGFGVFGGIGSGKTQTVTPKTPDPAGNYFENSGPSPLTTPTGHVYPY